VTARPELREQAERWLAEDPDPDTRAELAALLSDERALADRFGSSLRFGTAGLRGPVRAGPNGMNRVVVRRTAAGLAAWLAPGGPQRVVIGYDARRKSAQFAADSAAVLAGAGHTALLLPEPLPTPVLAFAVRHLSCAVGVMVTASHNPAADNGYKVYLADGGQLAPPVDAEIEAAIAAVGPLGEVPLSHRYDVLGPQVLAAYLDGVAALDLPPERDLRLAYTPLHGVGGQVAAAALRRAGFPEPAVVAEQAEPDPTFPTVAFPNPEEPGAMDLALALADRCGADLVLAHDPDADRLAVACAGRMLHGDEVGALLADALLRRGVRGTFATTIVSSSLLRSLCAAYGVGYAETLTGFKWLVRAAPDLVFAYEEALGYAVAPHLVRDKDGISAALVMAARAAELRAQGRTVLDRLDELAERYGVHATDQISLRVEDLGVISAAMRHLRASPPAELTGRAVSEVHDRLPEADVVTLRAEQLRVVVRPSGTEPKLKAYLEVVEPVGPGGVAAARARAAGRLAGLRAEVLRALGH